MRVLWVNGLAPNKLGGFESMCAAVSEELVRRGHRCYFAFQELPTEPVRLLLESAGATVTENIPSLGRVSTSLRLRQLAGRLRIDLIHIHFHEIFTGLGLLESLAGVTTVASYRISAARSKAGSFKRLGKRIRNGVLGMGIRRVYCVSGFTRRRFIENYVIAPEKVVTLYNAVDLRRFVGLRIPPAKSNPTIICVAALKPEKGIESLLRAFARVKAEVGDALLLVVGEGPMRGRAELLIEELEMTSSVKLLGRRDDVPQLLATADVAVVPSEWPEAFGFTVLEALAAGLPVIATNVGGIPEIVEDGVSGILIPPKDVDALSREIIALLTDPHARQEISQAARLRARRFDLADHARVLVNDYERLIRSSRRLSSASG